MTRLLDKDVPFYFDPTCHQAFTALKFKLTTVPILITPQWELPFEHMCDVSEFAVGVVLGLRIEVRFNPTIMPAEL